MEKNPWVNKCLNKLKGKKNMILRKHFVSESSIDSVKFYKFSASLTPFAHNFFHVLSRFPHFSLTSPMSLMSWVEYLKTTEQIIHTINCYRCVTKTSIEIVILSLLSLFFSFLFSCGVYLHGWWSELFIPLSLFSSSFLLCLSPWSELFPSFFSPFFPIVFISMEWTFSFFFSPFFPVLFISMEWTFYDVLQHSRKGVICWVTVDYF